MFQYSSFPFSYNRNYGRYGYYRRPYQNAVLPVEIPSPKKESPKEEIPKKEASEKSDTRTEDEDCFEIFGIKLHYDDILIVGLLFFLYNEGVKDEWLFISLVMLLLS